MPSHHPLVAVLCGLAALTLQTAQAAPPKPDFTNLPGYIKALDRSQDPEAAAIRQEIAGGPAALARERAAAQAEGIPLDAAQLRRPLPPPDQNAAPLYQQLDALRRDKPLNLPLYAQPLGVNYAYTPEQLAAVQAIFDSRRDVSDLLHRAALRPQCVFTRNWSEGAAVPFPEYAGLREDARELTTESFLLARQGRYSGAIATQALGFGVARHAASDPTLISYLVGKVIDSVTLSGLKNILYMAGPNVAVDAQVQAVIAQNPSPPSLKYALTGDVAFTLSALEPLRTNSATFLQVFVTHTDHSQSLSPDQAQFTGSLVTAAEAQYLSRILRLIDAADRPDSARYELFKSLALPEAFNANGPPPQILDPITKIESSFTPLSIIGHLAANDDQARATPQVLLAAAAVLSAKARNGAFPAALPGDFPDPFTGKALGYRREGPYGFVVYSVGTDGTFNGGGPGAYVFTPTQAFFRYPGPTPQPVPADMLK